MNYFLTLLGSIFFTSLMFGQTAYFVDQQNGDDNNSGTQSTDAFASIETAIDAVLPGDTVYLMGVFQNPSYDPNFSFTNDHDPHLWHQENTIRINNLNGTANNYITFKPYDGNTILKGDGANIFRVTNSSYLKITGFEIAGEVPSIPLSTALSLQFVYIDGNTVSDPNDPTAAEIKYRDEDCVSNCDPTDVVEGEVYSDLGNMDVIRPSYTDTRGLYLSKVNNIDITDCIIRDMPGGGLRVSDCEDINILRNEVTSCSRKSYSGTHALVVTKATSTRTTDDVRIYIANNRIHHNYNEIFSWSPQKTEITPHIDEGKGISLQRNETTYNGDGSIKVNWENGRILVENNLCYFNGFSGVHSNDGNRIDFINNTCYLNSYTKSITSPITSGNGGNIGISCQGGSDIRIVNNISIIDSALTKSAISSNISGSDGLVVSNNVIYGTSIDGMMGPIEEDPDVVLVQIKMIMANPLFSDPVNFDFGLGEQSPARDSALVSLAPQKDFYGNDRDASPDIGAVEYISQLTIDENDLSNFQVYPNPTTGLIHFEVDDLSKVRVFDLQGKEQVDFTYTNDMLDLSKMKSGTYFIFGQGKPIKVVKL